MSVRKRRDFALCVLKFLSWLVEVVGFSIASCCWEWERGREVADMSGGWRRMKATDAAVAVVQMGMAGPNIIGARA